MKCQTMEHGDRKNIYITPQLVAMFFCYPVVNIIFVDNSVFC